MNSESASTPKDEARSQAYYDEFSTHYDDRRGGNVPGGYHDMLDQLETDFVRRFAVDRDLLEVGCGTGLLLERFAQFAKTAKGIDLSEGMLSHARARGLDVVQGSATDLPFADNTFDVACSFKVLAHIPDIEKALSEMTRVVRPGGLVIGEFYNPRSLRALAKRAAGARKIGRSFTEEAVHTRFDSPEDIDKLMPRNTRLVASRGIRILTPFAKALEIPFFGPALFDLEMRLADTSFARFAGFYAVAYEKIA
jgi:ubiquinone/menaquinone biosynthesis C-methylase UbiE